MQTDLLTWLIPLPPLLAFGLIVLLAHRNNRISHTLAIGAMTLSWGLGMIVFWAAVTTEHLAEHPIASSVPWLPTGNSALRIGVFVDPLAAITLFFVAWTCLAIFVYSVGYHNFGAARDPQDRPGLPPRAGGIDPMYARFFAFISLFAFGMLTLVVSDNLLTLFVGWEIMGLCSYLLIGFWYAKPSAKAAAIKAFMTTRVGDVFMLLGIVALYSATMPSNMKTSPTRVVMKALMAAALAEGLAYQKPINKYEHRPMISQPTNKVSRLSETTSVYMPKANRPMKAKKRAYIGSTDGTL